MSYEGSPPKAFYRDTIMKSVVLTRQTETYRIELTLKK